MAGTAGQIARIGGIVNPAEGQDAVRTAASVLGPSMTALGLFVEASGVNPAAGERHHGQFVAAAPHVVDPAP